MRGKYDTKQILFQIIIILGISLIPASFAEANWENLEVDINKSERISGKKSDVIIIQADFKNNDDEIIVIYNDYVTLVDSKNRDFSNSIYYNLQKNRHDVTESDCPWGDSIQLNPGPSKNVNFCFDVPKENLSFVLHIYESDIDWCKNPSSGECQEKTIRLTVQDPDPMPSSSSDFEEKPLKIESSGDIIIAQGSSIPGCEENRSCYIPYRLDAGKGSTITWENMDSTAHTVTSGTPDNGPTSNFDSDIILPGALYSHKFEKDDVINYFCTLHPWMTGLLNITRSGVVISNDDEGIGSNDKSIQKIPDWIKNNAQWWSSDKISESEFLRAIEYLIENKIIKIPISENQNLQSIRTTHTLPDSRSTEYVEISGSFTEKHEGPLTLTIVKPDKSEEKLTTFSRDGTFMTTMTLTSESLIGNYQVFAEIKGNQLLVSGFNVKGTDSNKVPSWIKNNAKWWSQGLITDGDFISGIEHLIKNNILKV